MKTSWEQNVLLLYINFELILFLYWLVQNLMYKNGTSILILILKILKIGTCYKINAENITLPDLLFYKFEPFGI